MSLFNFYKRFLFLLNAETAHNLAIFLLKNNLIIAAKQQNFAELHCKVAGLEFNSPIGLAAGFDKNAECIKNLSKFAFGFLEFGTVTPKAQSGNPQPRLFRLSKEQAIINRMGFNNKGKQYFKSLFNKSANKSDKILGINIGKNKSTESDLADYLELLEYFYEDGDYLTINISSPNTPNLRDLQKKETLNNFIREISRKRDLLNETTKQEKIIFLKIAPDVSETELNDICAIALKYKIDALIIGNTTISRPDELKAEHKEIIGGLSGKPLAELANQKIAAAYKILRGKIPIIGVGGVSNAHDAYHKIKLGANLIQIYSALIYQGMSLPKKINQDLVKLLKADGYKIISEAVGKSHEGI